MIFFSTSRVRPRETFPVGEETDWKVEALVVAVVNVLVP
jgi:hypothetical protein